MASNWRVRGPAVPELAAAGVVLILGAVGATKLALAPPTGLPMSLTTWSVLMVLLAILLAASGIESIRRRNFLFVVLAPLMPALVTLGYVIQTGQTGVLSQVWIAAVLMAVVASKRSDFA